MLVPAAFLPNMHASPELLSDASATRTLSSSTYPAVVHPLSTPRKGCPTFNPLGSSKKKVEKWWRCWCHSSCSYSSVSFKSLLIAGRLQNWSVCRPLFGVMPFLIWIREETEISLCAEWNGCKHLCTNGYETYFCFNIRDGSANLPASVNSEAISFRF